MKTVPYLVDPEPTFCVKLDAFGNGSPECRVRCESQLRWIEHPFIQQRQPIAYFHILDSVVFIHVFLNLVNMWVLDQLDLVDCFQNCDDDILKSESIVESMQNVKFGAILKGSQPIVFYQGNKGNKITR